MIGSKAIVCGAVALLSALVVFAVIPIIENAADRSEAPATNRVCVSSAETSVPATNRAEVSLAEASAPATDRAEVSSSKTSAPETNRVEVSPAKTNAAAVASPAKRRRQPEGKSPFVIDEIVFAGETNLIRQAEVRRLVRELLCDGFPKTERSVRSSLAYASIELDAAGYGTGTLVYLGSEAFDPAARRLTVTVRRGRRSQDQGFLHRPDRHRHVAKAPSAATPASAVPTPSAAAAVTSAVGRVAFEVRECGEKPARAFSPTAAAPLAGLVSVEPQARVSGPLVQTVAAARKARADEPLPEVPIVEEVCARTLSDNVRLGVIRTIGLTGPAAFIEDEGVLKLLSHPLCDGCVKTVGDLRRALAEARAELVRRGFLLVSLVPASDRPYHADTQTVDIAVRPGTYGDVAVTMKGGNGAGNWHGSRQVERYFKDLKAGEAFNYNDFRHALGRLNANPDFVADATVAVSAPAPGDAEAAGRKADLKLEVEDSFPLHGSLQFDNHAMEELGYWQTALLLQYLNLTGAGDTISVSPAMTLNGDMWSLAGSYLYPFEWLWGGRFSAAGGYSRLNTEDVSPRLDLVGAGAYAGLGMSFNLWDSDRRNLAVDLGLQWRYLNDVWSMPDYDIPGRDLHILPLAFGLSYVDRRRDWLGGLDFLNAGETVNLWHRGDFDSFVEDGQPNYWIFRGSWSRLQPLAGPDADGEEWRCWSLFTRLEGQYSAQSLLTAERLALGGHSALRGYRTRGYIGDNGIYGTVEFRTPVFCDPITSLFRLDEGQSAVERFQFHAFTDLGDVGFNDELPGFERSEFLWSAGLGMRMGLTRFFSLNFDLAFPLRKAYLDEKDRSMELYLSVKGQY